MDDTSFALTDSIVSPGEDAEMSINSKKSLRSQWKHRRSRSTSSLVLTCEKSDSDDTSKERNDLDDAERSLARLTINNTNGLTGGGPGVVGGVSSSTRSKLIKSKIVPGNVVESDSFNEIFGTPYMKSLQQSGRRRRRHKRMAVEAMIVGTDDSVFKEPLQIASPTTTTTNAFGLPQSHSLDNGFDSPQSPATPLGLAELQQSQPGPSSSNPNPRRVRKKINHSVTSSSIYPAIFDIIDTNGKRKRTNREKFFGGMDSSGTTSSSSCSTNFPSAVEFNSMIGIGLNLLKTDDGDEVNEGGDHEMQCDGDEDVVSNISSSDESIPQSCDDGQEGDDEQSDWVGDEWMDGDFGDSEKRRDLMIRRLKDLGPSREIRAGRRRIHPNKPVFSIRTSANEQLSKFLQDPEQSQITLHPMRKDERIQLGQIASLYSLKMHNADSGGGGLYTCPVLTKTRNTTQVDLGKGHSKVTSPFGISPLEPSTKIESETEIVKRIKM